MTAYLDEYNPNSARVESRVQSDPQKLKYNNIQSCIAVALWPSLHRHLVGVHLTTLTAGRRDELATAMAELRDQVGHDRAEAYLLAGYSTHYANTHLRRGLKRFTRRLWVCDVVPVGATGAVDLDVKIELVHGEPAAFVRAHAGFQTDTSGRRIPKPAPPRGFRPGQPRQLLDKTEKPWMRVEFTRL